MPWTAKDLRALTRALPLYKVALGQEVTAVVQINAILCCRLTDGLILGAQFAIEHGELEVLLGRMDELPQEFRRSGNPHPMSLLLAGRRFRGFLLCDGGDLGFDFDQCILRFNKTTGTAIVGRPKQSSKQ